MCTSPIKVTRINGNLTKVVDVPCGKCAECFKKKQSNYTCRCIEEAKKYGRVWFITLTYSENNCPVNMNELTHKQYRSLRREDIKKWKREVRKKYLRLYNKPFPRFSFLICGEYGSRTKRPHYHGFLCGLDLKHAQFLEKYWQDNFGFTTFKSIDLVPKNGHDDISCVARYVSKYCVKPQLYNLNSVQEKPRIQTSSGFGVPEDFDRYKNYMRAGLSLSPQKFSLAQLSKINERCKYSYNGVDYSLPLYLRKKIFYEKNFKGNLSSSKLSKLCSLALRSDDFANLLNELRQMESSLSEREIFEKVNEFVECFNLNIESRRDSSKKNLLNDYKKDSF